MGCNCGGGSTANVAYKVVFNDGSTQTYTTAAEARAAVRTRGGGTIRAVQAAKV